MNRLILLVDDDEDGRSLLCAALRRRGFETESVDSARACLSRLAASDAAIVVTDVQMPMMSGIELCGALRSRYPTIQVVVMSGAGDPAIATAARAMGAVTFLPKPVSLGALEVVLRDALAITPT